LTSVVCLQRIVIDISKTYVTFASVWGSSYYVIAVNYDRYFIAKHCSVMSNKRRYLPCERIKYRIRELYQASSQIWEPLLLVSSCTSALHTSAPTESILIKCDIWRIYENRWRKFKTYYNLKNYVYFIFRPMRIHDNILIDPLLKWQLYQANLVEKIKTKFSINFFYRKLWKIWCSQTSHRYEYKIAQARCRLEKHAQNI
jgi:hypothetical protein